MIIKNAKRQMCVLAILFAGCAFPGSAGTISEYTDTASFTSASSSLTTIDFEGINTQGGSDVNENSGLTIDLVQFTGYEGTGNGSCPNNCYLQVENPGFMSNWGSGSYLIGPSKFTSTTGLDAALPGSIYALAANVMSGGSGSSYSDAVTVLVTNGDGTSSYSINTISGFSSMAFVGFVSSTPITSIAFAPTSLGDKVVIDNFAFGQGASQSQSDTSPAPETSTSLLCGGGLLLFGQFLRRRATSRRARA